MTTIQAPDSAAQATQRILDIDDGLDRIMGDRNLYGKLLRRFQHDHQDTPRQIRDAIAAERHDAARLRCHTLKGAAGMIGADATYEAAAVLETALRAHALALDAPLVQLETALQQLLAHLADVLQAAPQRPPVHGSAPAPAVQLLLARLASCLREGDGAAIDLLETSATLLASSLGVRRYQQVAAAAHEFDFEAALAALQSPG